jgi:hypothetical protein
VTVKKLGKVTVSARSPKGASKQVLGASNDGIGHSRKLHTTGKALARAQKLLGIHGMMTEILYLVRELQRKSRGSRERCSI